ncbi:probable 3-hydroxyisobutyrate dehydrogenase-like 2, mitochondrial [Pistacia vera]|uniref:probable 3-hydroxyisobutyrate dehydrogenase-like 2, mitochondrial n=1 Tax=Pistacia vera TaxID=55513 RepID=UPI001262D703|nr:probable 3-hydroxyisobutyrate dehydrogenase-like 2, mitochondrial [Pistacia vera]XP_031262753.1 probable 3-hydroxyisobutyrate dehydrogenase-like 2, mitochondrial [Pistacia vera]
METPYPKPISPTKTRVGWIGIGAMGAAMASRLLSAGYCLTIFARNPSKALPLQSKGATLVNSLHDVARSSDVVFTMVGNPQDVRSVVLENNGILSGLNPGAVLVDTTSSHPALAREIFKATRDKDCWAVDAPVSGGDIGARDGKLAIFAAGDGGVVEWLSPLFEVMGKHTYIGKAGCGQSCKIANQIVVGANLMGLSEGLVFAEKAGLDVRKWRESVRGGAAGSMVMELFGERMIEKDFRPGGFAEYMVKDMGMGVDVVEESEVERVVVLPGAALGTQMFSAMVANGDGKFGTQGLISVIERINGNPEMLDPGRGGRARSKRLCPATFNTCPPVQLISPTSSVTEAQQPFVAPKVPSDSENFAESHLVANIPKQFNSEYKKREIKFTTLQDSTKNNKNQPTQAVRKCMHCEITRTPQWRAGPLGPKTLCNACGVRYKSGRLFPEYRPRASPTFVPSLHSNSHEKVLEMRSKGGEKHAMGGIEKMITNSQELISNK